VIKIVIPIPPQPKARPRVYNGIAFTPAKTKAYESAVALLIRKYFPVPFECALSVRMEFFMSKAVSNKKPYPTQSPDIDNLAKAILDAGNGLIYKDDSQVIELNIVKRWATIESPAGTVLTVKEFK